MSAWYNEVDPLKAAVLREAIKAKAIAPGDVDERSIADVQPADLVGYTQCHFFAGGGFWSLAARRAGWPDDRPMWTGSCPCPSFSAAGKGGGFTDPRHLWPDWARLIAERKPPALFGEQADDAIGYGWLDLVQTDLEAQEYAVGKAVLGAASIGAPHIRQRLYFVGELEEPGYPQMRRSARRSEAHGGRSSGALAGSGNAGKLGNAGSEGLEGRCGSAGSTVERAARPPGMDGSMAYSDGRKSRNRDLQRSGEYRLRQADGRDSPVCGFWSDAEWIPMRHPKIPGAVEWRPIKRGAFPLAPSYPGRLAELRLAGDAICIPVAQAFIAAYMGTREVVAA